MTIICKNGNALNAVPISLAIVALENIAVLISRYDLHLEAHMCMIPVCINKKAMYILQFYH